MSLGELIRKRRTELGLSQAQLGEKVGRTGSTVRRWERGEAVPGSDLVEDLASALRINSEQLRAADREPERSDRTDPEVAGPAPAVPRSTQPSAPPRVKQPTGTGPRAPQHATATPQTPAPAPGAPPRPATPAPRPVATPATAVDERPTEMAPIPVAPAAMEAEPPRTPRFAFRRRTAAVPGASYLEDTRQRWRYWLRYGLTGVALFIGFIIMIWAVGELTDALGRVWELFGEAESPDTTSLGTDF